MVIVLYPFKCKRTYLHQGSESIVIGRPCLESLEKDYPWSCCTQDLVLVAQPTHINKFRVGKLKYRVGNIKKNRFCIFLALRADFLFNWILPTPILRFKSVPDFQGWRPWRLRDEHLLGVTFFKCLFTNKVIIK